MKNYDVSTEQKTTIKDSAYYEARLDVKSKKIYHEATDGLTDDDAFLAV